ncbi:ribbon-helix-helix protein, CopG family [Pseudarthrobacter psychrotolerans]|uniref:Ribbon-helix-helix protein, CopG family n=1 Tax=Pseudarthrobacter psychrotolerans TaxID=2697569 RepID=A0A6P1NM38_9MICC|nr:ribbon-helix-helix protein, CopG family [Pseudarthrobacter psychrotolerans]QHK20103.1 ribbon-helix-helix protein, CopG family [Pseudarthrobacter psychrotolerans]
MNETKKAKASEELDAEEQARSAALATWAETADIGPDASINKADGPEAGRSLLEAALGSPEAIRRAVGKPSLSAKGTSPSRSLRLPVDMDARLVEQAQKEHRNPSAIIRDALAEYLAKAS